MDEQEKKAFTIALLAGVGAAAVATIIGYWAYKYYTKTSIHPMHPITVISTT